MIKYYRKTQKVQKLEEISEFKPGSWLYIELPTPLEISRLASKFSLEPGHLADALDPNEVSRLEFEGDIAYIYTRIPLEEKGNVTTLPLLIILGKNFLATITARPLPIFTKFIEDKIDFFTTQKVRLFIQIFAEINNHFNRTLVSLNRGVNQISGKLEKISNSQILQFVVIEKILNELLNTLNRTNTILINLLSGKNLPLYKEDRELVEDILLTNGQLIDYCKSTLLLTGNVREAYSTILANNLNRVMKLMTSLTIIMTIPTIIASLFGMNVPLPLVGTSQAFLIIILLAFFISITALILFRRRGWL
jgi:magnesium transporter